MLFTATLNVKNLRQFAVFFISALALTACGSQLAPKSSTKERWDSANNPVRMLPRNYNYRFDDLPLEGTTDYEPWADSYWPSKKGGLSYQWMDNVAGHKVTPVTPSAAASLSAAKLAALSPAEKFDIFVGDESMSLFNNEIERTSPEDGAWFGICHGWSAVSMTFSEPKAVILKGPSGIEVPFGSTDVKGLLSLYSAEYANVGTRFLASRCNEDISKNPDAARNPECRDVNAGAFHLVITNLIGLRKEGFVADVTRDLEVWNQPVYGFKSKILGDYRRRSPGAAWGTVREVEVETEMTYGLETSPQWESVGASMDSKVYKYRIEISPFGSVLGGEWLTEERPDFMWASDTPEFVSGRGNRSSSREIKWEYLRQIYEASVAASDNAKNPVDENGPDR